MSTTTVRSSPPAKAPPRPVPTPAPTPQASASPEARRTAAIVLEVLSGLRTPVEACTELGCVLPTYYKIEARALDGLVAALEPRPRGRQRTASAEVAALRRDKARLEQELARHQSLVRVSYRSFGLSASRATGKKDPPKTKGKRRSKPKVRARRAIAAMRPVTQDPMPSAITMAPRS